MGTVAWFHPFSGIAGDMALGALLDAGADLDGVRAALESTLPGGRWSLGTDLVDRAGLRATRAVVETDEDGHHRTWRDIRELLAGADLAPRARERARAVFAALAEAEGHLHGVAPDDVHFHEVGGLDALVDVLGTCVALELLGVDDVRSGPVRVGLGEVRAAHGVLPSPAPATLALLAAAGAPVVGTDVDVELTTPTGAALLAGLAAGFGALPAITLGRVGYGAGSRDVPGRANVVQVVIGTTTLPGGDEAVLAELAANVDDVTGEVLAHTVQALLAAGARDAWLTPIIMKKGRPAHTVHALCELPDVTRLRDLMAAETGSLGVRAAEVRRWAAARDEVVVEVEGHRVRVKRAAHRVKAEHDDVAAAAAVLGWPVREVAVRAEQAARRLDGRDAQE